MAQTAAHRDPFYRILGVAAALVLVLACAVPSMGTSTGSEVAVAAPDATATTVGAVR